LNFPQLVFGSFELKIVLAMTKVLFSDECPGKISYVVIGARYNGKWAFIRHRERGGYEIPAGHPEEGESDNEAAARELTEETGAGSFTMRPVCYYTVVTGNDAANGRLYLSEVKSFGEIRDTDEVERLVFSDDIPGEMSLPVVMKALFERLRKELLKDNIL